MIYLRTLISAPNEIKLIKLALRESFDYIDKFIVCEFNRTHVGSERQLIFEQYLEQFTEAERRKLVYLGADVSKEVRVSRDGEVMHANERLMRGYFAKEIDLRKDDVVIATDADEIIYGPAIPQIVAKLGFFNRSIVVPLHQFFYKMNYLWENKAFVGPVICKAGFFTKTFPAQWRYAGKPWREPGGCHFSWCLTTEEMIHKLNTYAHHDLYGHLAQREVLEAAVRDRTYPFDPGVDFRIRPLDIHRDRGYYPQAFYGMVDEFTSVMDG